MVTTCAYLPHLWRLFQSIVPGTLRHLVSHPILNAVNFRVTPKRPEPFEVSIRPPLRRTFVTVALLTIRSSLPICHSFPPSSLIDGNDPPYPKFQMVSCRPLHLVIFGQLPLVEISSFIVAFKFTVLVASSVLRAVIYVPPVLFFF